MNHLDLTTANEEISLILVFHKPEAAAKAASALAASFPKASSIFADLMTAKSQGVAMSTSTKPIAPMPRSLFLIWGSHSVMPISQR